MSTKAASLPQTRLKPPDGVTLAFIFVAALMLPLIPLVNLLLYPLNSLSTMIHEMGHAVGCLLTGGSVAGMTIVSDGAGHGGLTFCHGGNPFVYGQTGYLGTTIMGCALIALGRLPRIAKGTLLTLGIAFGLGSLIFMGGTMLNGNHMQGFLSLLLGLALAGAFIKISLSVNAQLANLLLLFVGVEMGLNALSDVWTLIALTLGWYPKTWSDASNMAQLTGVPSFIWAVGWAALSAAMLWFTIAWTYKVENEN